MEEKQISWYIVKLCNQTHASMCTDTNVYAHVIVDSYG
jgi:hypothetical protein